MVHFCAGIHRPISGAAAMPRVSGIADYLGANKGARAELDAISTMASLTAGMPKNMSWSFSSGMVLSSQ
jgi:hypothetical protein